MDTPLCDAATAARLLEHARKLYDDLSEELSLALDTLRSEQPDPEAKGRAETIRSHRKALQTVLEIQIQFVKQNEERGAPDAIDLQAARAEIIRRLDRLSSERRD
ncbi:MAG: hypothetical protein AAF360_08435 [Pseudomonadota bacterium]